MIEFEANSNQKNFSDISLFLAIKKYHLQSDLDTPILFEKPLLPTAKNNIKIANKFIKTIELL